MGALHLPAQAIRLRHHAFTRGQMWGSPVPIIQSDRHIWPPQTGKETSPASCVQMWGTRSGRERKVPCLRPFNLYIVQLDVLKRPVLGIALGTRVLVHHVLALHYLAENSVLAGEPGGGRHRDEELRPVSVGAGVGHGQFARAIELVR